MEIRFLGLIVHTRLFESGTQVAVLMQHDTHHAYLTVPDGQVDWDKTTATPKQENGVSCFALRGHVAAPRSGSSKTAGITELPQVDDMRNPGETTLHPGIVHREHHPNLFHALFEIPRGGELTIEDYFVYQGIHKFNIGCVGRTVLYTLDVEDTVEFTLRHDGGKIIALKGDADRAYVTNRCAVSNTGESDQSAYGKFFSPAADSITPVTLVMNGSTPVKCAKGTAETPITTCAGTLAIKPSAPAPSMPSDPRSSKNPKAVQIENIDVDCTSTRYP